MLKIGITIGIQKLDESLWTNGIKLNVLIFTEMLQNTNKYDIYLLNIFTLDYTNKPGYLKPFNIVNLEDVYEDMDLIISMGAEVELNYVKQYRTHPNKKLISYKCGDNYMFSAESVLFKKDAGNINKEYTMFDEVWYIPQLHKNNSGFFKVLYRSKTFTVPFVWNPKYLQNSLNEIDRDRDRDRDKSALKYPTKYIPSEKKVIGIMEPNINLVKYCMIPIMIAEEFFRTYPDSKDSIQNVMITNSTGENNISNHKEFLSIIKSFDLFKSKKISAESRYQTAYLLSQHVDLVISHQIMNPLNFIYLDIAYMGYPLLHNAPYVKDLGYYYPDSDVVEGAKKLEYILTEHDKHIDEYNERNKIVINRYLSTNPDIIETYHRLIENVMTTGNSNLVYNGETNLYDS